MAKPFDASLKDLIESYPADWLAFLGPGLAAAVDVIDADVSTVSAAADKVLRVAADPPWLLHLELQASPKKDLDEWLLWYNVLLGHRHRLPVRTVLVLLRPAGDLATLTGTYRQQFAAEAPYLEFRYRVMRLWQVPVADVLAGGLGLLPLAPLAAGAEGRLPEVVTRMEERLRREAQASQAELLWTTTYILMGLRYPKELAAQVLQGVRSMEESVTYQAIINKGIARGREEGRREGRHEGAIEELHKTMLRLGRKRFGAADAATIAALEGIADLERLERMSERLLEVNSWPDLLAVP